MKTKLFLFFLLITLRQIALAQTPSISSFSPGSGQIGNTVTVYGSNFTGITSVRFGEISAPFTVNSSSQLTVTVPRVASTQPIIVTNANGYALSPSAYIVTRANPTLTYSLVAGNFASVNVGSEAAPAVGDLDNDGLLDLLVGRADGTVSRYEQTVTNGTVFNSLGSLSDGSGTINMSGRVTVAIVDANGDGKFSVMLGRSDGYVYEYEQTVINSTTFTQVNPFLGTVMTGGNAVVGMTDLSGDGRLEFLTGKLDGIVGYFNQNGVNNPEFYRENSDYLTLTSNTSPFCVDLDGNGLIDVLIGVGSGTMYHFEQSAANSTFVSQVTSNFNSIDVGNNAKPCVTDIDGDGLLDLLIGRADGTIDRYEQGPPQNSAPTDISLNPASVLENQSVDTVVGTLSSTDAQGGTFIYTFASGGADNGSFNISGNILTTNGVFDYESKNSYSIRIRSTDQGGLSFEKTLSVSVTNVNETPTISNFTPTSGPVSTNVTVNGNHFNDAGNVTVRFNGMVAPSVTVNSNTELMATVPSGATTGTISVQNADGTGASSNNFTVVPQVSSVSVPANNTYGIGATLTFNVVFNQPVTVIGTPSIPLTVGSNTRTVNYVSGSGGTTLVFSYEVVNDDLDNDGVSLGAAINLNSGTIRNGTTDASLTLNNVGATTGVRVDGIIPTVNITSSASNPTPTSPIPVSIAFSESVTGFAVTDIAVTNGTKGTLSGSGANYTLPITPSGTGTVTITVSVSANSATDGAGNGNTVSNMFTITYSPPPLITGFAVLDNTVCVGSPITFTATIGNVTGSYNYTLTNGTSSTTGATSSTAFSHNLVASGNGGQSFSLIVSANGQSTFATTNVTVNSLPTAGLTNNGPLSCTLTNVTLTASGGTSYTFTNSSGQELAGSGNTRSVSAPGTYSVTVANASGCVSTTQTTVGIVTITVMVINPSTTTATQGTAFGQTFTASGGAAPYSFSLASGTLPTGLTLTSSSGVLSGTPTQSGSFSITVRATESANGCSGVSATYTLVVNAATPTITGLAATPNPVCAGTSITFTATIGNVTGTYNYTLTNGTSSTAGATSSTAFSQNVTATGTGTQSFSLIVSDNSQSATSITNVTVSTPPSATIAYAGSPFSTSASPVNVTHTGTAGGTYTTSPAGLSINASTGQITPSGSSPGSYTVTYTVAASGGCPAVSATASVGIEAPIQRADVSVSIGSEPSAVPGGLLSYTISISNAGPNSATNVQMTDVLPASLMIVSATASYSNGTVVIDPPMNNTVHATIPLLGAGDVARVFIRAGIDPAVTGTLSNTASVTSATSDPDLTNNSSDRTIPLTPQADLSITCTDGVSTVVPGSPVTYTITATNSGPSNAPNSMVVNTFPTSLTGLTWTAVGAGGGTVTASGSGDINQTVNLPVGGSVTFTVNATLRLTAVGSLSNTATVTPTGGVTDPVAGNNSATDNDTVTPLTPTITNFSTNPATVCAGGPITFTATVGNVTGTYNYTLTNGSSPQIGTASGNFSLNVPASGSGPQTYTLTVASNEQTTTATANVIVSSLPVANILTPASTTLTCGSPTLSLTATGGGTYRWDDNSINAVRLVSSSGTYSVTVTSASGCTASSSTIISQDNSVPTVSISPASATLSCANPIATLTASGNGNFRWTNGATTSAISVSTAGTYSATLTGGNGCTAIASAQVSQNNALPIVSIAATPSLTIASGQSATLTASGATMYQWSTGAAINPIVVSTPGIYSVTGTTGNCSAQASVTVFQTSQPTGTFAITAVTTNTCSQIAANRYVVSFTPQYSGLNGQPVSVSVVNEMFPTTAPGPYTLQFYTDNSPVVLKAQQPGTVGEVSFTYNWLATCTSPQPNTPPRVNQPLTDQVARVGEGFGYTIPQFTFTDNESPQSLVLTVSGLPAGLNFTPPVQIGGVPSTTGVTTVTVTATDPQGLSVNTSFRLTVVEQNATNTPPTLVNPIPNQVVIQNQPFGLDVSTTFTDAQTPIALTLTASGLPTGLMLMGTTLSGTPSQTGTSTITLTAVDAGGLTTSTSFGFTVQPASGTVTGTFAITGVSPITCTQVANNRYTISFTPRYAGVNGQTISFQVVNEMAPTTAPGPYSLQLYTDNATIVLKARQEGSPGETSFSYNWLATCTSPQPNTPPRVNQPLTDQVARVGEGFGYTIPQLTFTDNESPQSLVLTVSGLPAGLSFTPPSQIGGVPSVTGVSTVMVTATDPQGLSVSTLFSLTVLPQSVPSGFAITGVQTLSCVAVSGGRRAVTFAPQYSGTNGQPISFSVVNELLPTTATGPYTLELYPDNPTMRLRAVQGGSQASYDYNWLGACSIPARQGVSETGTGLQVHVLGNPVEGQTIQVEVSGVVGQRLMFRLVNGRGRAVSQKQIDASGERESVTLPIDAGSGVYLLQVSTPHEQQTIKLIKN